MSKNTENAIPVSFETISLTKPVKKAIRDLKYDEATDIQAKCIPLLLNGKDVIGNSSTGTGKTAAFGIPAVENVDTDMGKAQVLILSPTRELAMQITKEMQKYAKYIDGITIAAVFGGASMSDQIRLLRKANIVVGTPGRVMDHMRRKTLKLDNIKMIVLDEADEMLSMGFIDDIHTILSQAPKERQTALFSATMPLAVIKISKEFLKKPIVVDVLQEKDNQADIEQTFYYVPRNKKVESICLLLGHANVSRTMIFCNTKSMVDELTSKLNTQGFNATGIHGDMSQAIRSQVMQRFRDGVIEILVATDVAARGIDVDDVESVINFDIPQTFEYYVHRIGRTGRIGKKGLSQTLVSNKKQVARLRSLMRFTGSTIKEHDLPTSEEMMEKAVAKQAEKLFPLLQKSHSKSANMLMKRLLATQDSGFSMEDIAYSMAEIIMGGDEKYDTSIYMQEELSKSKRKPDKQRKNVKIVTVTASIGRKSKLAASHLLRAIADALDISGEDIGKIDIQNDITKIGLYKEDALNLIELRKPVRIKGNDVSFTLEPENFVKRKRSGKHIDYKSGNKARRKSSSRGQRR